MKKAIILALLVLSSCSGKWYKETSDGLRAQTSLYDVELVCYDRGVVRIVKSPLGIEASRSEPLSLNLERKRCTFELSEPSEGVVRLATDSIRVFIFEDGSPIRFENARGESLLRESEHCCQNCCQGFILSDDEAIYGLGQHRGGDFNLRGKSRLLRNENMEISIPLIHSSKGYALWWNNYSETGFKDDEEGMTFTSDTGDDKDYFVIYGGSADGVIREIRSLTGEAPMFPLWSYGFLQSRERYTSADQLVGMVSKFRQERVPLDGIIQDWQYWGTDHAYWNAVEFLNPEYSDPETMLSDIHSMNAHCMISVWPSFGPKTNIYKDLEAANALLPFETFPQGNGVRNFDPFNPKGQDIYWSYLKNIYDKGMDGWWLDATEPECTIKDDRELDARTAAGPFRELRNAYALACVEGVYERQMKYDPLHRPLILTRSASLGTQRYAHCWSGDVVSGWKELADQIPAALSFSLTGLPYWNSDIGGFFSGNNFPQGNKDPEFQRLYLRWMQLGVFSGMMRSHGTNTPREIFNFGASGGAMYDAQLKCINLRYRLLPYIYSTAYQISANAATLMRPLMMDYAGCEDVKDEFMFGRSLLVAPIVTDEAFREVLLPDGSWTDFWTGQKKGGSFECDDFIPLFVKAGTILPIGPQVQYSTEKPWDDLQLRIYPGADGSFVLYEDEGDGFGGSSKIEFKWNDREGKLEIARREGSFEGMPKTRKFRLAIVREGFAVGLGDEDFDVEVEYSGSSISVDFNKI